MQFEQLLEKTTRGRSLELQTANFDLEMEALPILMNVDHLNIIPPPSDSREPYLDDCNTLRVQCPYPNAKEWPFFYSEVRDLRRSLKVVKDKSCTASNSVKERKKTECCSNSPIYRIYRIEPNRHFLVNGLN